MTWRKEEEEIILFKVLSIFLNSKSRLWLFSECNFTTISVISYSHLNQQRIGILGPVYMEVGDPR